MIYQQFKNSFLQFAAQKKHFSRVLIAYSGGLDSSVLLELLARLSGENLFHDEIKIIVVHINHAIHRHADGWQKHCEKSAKQYGFEFYSYVLEGLTNQDSGKIANLEKEARERRYQIFCSISQPDDLWLFGHHQDDQAETVLFNLFKGHGQNALSGIPASRPLDRQNKTGALLFRPLLDFSKAELLLYAQARQLTWVEDDSNRDEHFSRNFIRQQILPKIKQQWPEVLANISRSARFLSENQMLLNSVAETDFLACVCVDAHLNRWGESISLAVFARLDRVRQKHVIRFWLDKKHLLMPGHKVLDELLDASSQTGASNKLVSWKQDALQINFCCFEQHLFLNIHSIVEELPSDPVRWNLLQEPLKRIHKKHFSAQLQSTALFKNALLNPAINILDLHFRKGGEHCRPSERQHSQSLKKLLQEYRVPPWERDKLPLFYYQDELVAVADLWVCAGYRANDETGWLLVCES